MDEDSDGLTQLTLRVEDTGVGFSSDHAARLFDRFSQADSTITRRFGGTGLGLSICRSLVELMGGRISAASTPGVGSRFTVEIPLTRAASLSEHDAQRRARAAESDRALAPLHVLLAEDHPVNQRVVQLILAAHAMQVVTVSDGEQALAAFQSETFDLILMDMQMPVLDGLEATRRIRAEEAEQQRPRVTIIAMTANAREEDRQVCLAAGMDDFVSKPIRMATLVEKLRAL